MAAKVLLADHSLKSQKELTRLLQGAGIEVVSVSNGEHAVRQLPTLLPDLVLAEVFLPVRSGYEVCGHIKGTAELAHIPVLLLADKMAPFDEQRARLAGADGKLEKPFADPQSALQTIQKHLGKILAQKPPAAAEKPAAERPPEAVEVSEPVSEAELFFTGPKPTTFEPQAQPIGFAQLLEEEMARAPEAGRPSPSAVAAERESVALREADARAKEFFAAKEIERLLPFYAEDAALLPPRAAAVTGREGIRRFFTDVFRAPGFAMRWPGPIKVEVSGGGGLGYVMGRYEFTAQDAQGSPTTDRGKYVSVWKKQPDGKWRFVADIWNSDQPEPAVEE